MTPSCGYHWMYVRDPLRGIRCAECDQPIEENPAKHPIGFDHFLSPTEHSASCATRGAGGPLNIGGVLVMHFQDNGRECEGAIGICKNCDPENAQRPIWDAAWLVDHVGDLAFLTLSPSLLCGCGDHGFVREGKWVPA